MEFQLLLSGKCRAYLEDFALTLIIKYNYFELVVLGCGVGFISVHYCDCVVFSGNPFHNLAIPIIQWSVN